MAYHVEFFLWFNWPWGCNQEILANDHYNSVCIAIWNFIEILISVSEVSPSNLPEMKPWKSFFETRCSGKSSKLMGQPPKSLPKKLQGNRWISSPWSCAQVPQLDIPSIDTFSFKHDMSSIVYCRWKLICLLSSSLIKQDKNTTDFGTPNHLLRRIQGFPSTVSGQFHMAKIAPGRRWYPMAGYHIPSFSPIHMKEIMENISWTAKPKKRLTLTTSNIAIEHGQL